MNTLLKAEHHSWGLQTNYDWRENCFELSTEGDLHIIVKYLDPVVDCTVRISDADFDKIRKLIPKEYINTEVVACDGEAWSFIAYDESGEVSFSRDIGYIYGITVLENIGDILESYIPDYDVPQYESDYTPEKREFGNGIIIPAFIAGAEDK